MCLGFHETMRRRLFSFIFWVYIIGDDSNVIGRYWPVRILDLRLKYVDDTFCANGFVHYITRTQQIRAYISKLQGTQTRDSQVKKIAAPKAVE